MTPLEGDIRVLVDQVGDWSLPRELLEEGVRAALEIYGPGEGEVSLTFLDDEGISALNQEHLGKEGPTDVIAFALHGHREPVFGDIYVGYEQARRQSSELDIPLAEELLRLAIHGTLHVLGFEHPEGGDRFESPMYQRQEELLARVLAQSGG
jgi:probable rRNA maturation factor